MEIDIPTETQSAPTRRGRPAAKKAEPSEPVSKSAPTRRSRAVEKEKEKEKENVEEVAVAVVEKPKRASKKVIEVEIVSTARATRSRK
jgi:hypothetical protein